MNCTVNVFLLNEHFSQEHADAHYKGEESENNQKYEWEDEFVITSDVKTVVEHEHAVYPLRGQLPDGTSFSHEVINMFLFEIQSSNADPVFVGASESIVDSHSLSKDESGYKIKLYLKDFEPMANPIPGIYIASKEFPKELID